ncbi:MAG: hypothetical protein EKK50_13500 [Sphingomonadaceae bacterium]|uniref:hypothetical protein n=1 Tax=Methylobacterium oryzae TaxID=334852 RepID=UPI000FC239D1|nr:hypothetical protein [Methylobacterium oryzae]RTL15252.1 MAG: hypothetical protein EKK50_13500 [Sphingomonadaceae bacterium]UIN35155.1 hypothetical protein LXM90_01230 [Methylobacterium oryzae]
MTAREQAAFAAGIEMARQMALTAAAMVEVREDGREVRQQWERQRETEAGSGAIEERGSHSATPLAPDAGGGHDPLPPRRLTKVGL